MSILCQSKTRGPLRVIIKVKPSQKDGRLACDAAFSHDLPTSNIKGTLYFRVFK